MIEINLSPQQKTTDLTNVGGFNLSLVNFKFLVIFIIILYSVEPGLDMMYEDNIKKLEADAVTAKKRVGKLRGQLRKYADVKKQVKDLQAQETSLAQKINVVKEIVDKRQNPFLVLKYIAVHTPENVWITELELDDHNLRMRGFSKTWTSIGSFIEELRKSIFFNGAVNYAKPEGGQNEFNGHRVEPFEITTVVTSFK